MSTPRNGAKNLRRRLRHSPAETPEESIFLRSVRHDELLQIHDLVLARFKAPRRRRRRGYANSIVFVVGVPGTGKTSGVHDYLEAVTSAADWLPGVPVEAKVVRLGAFSFNSLFYKPGSRLTLFLLEILKHFSPDHYRPRPTADAEALLRQIAEVAGEHFVILCIDEFEELDKLQLEANLSAQALVIDLVARYLPRCVLVAISNDLDIESKVNGEMCAVHKVVFEPYTFEELKELYLFRTQKCGKKKKRSAPELTPAIEYGIRCIARHKGDGRLMLDMLSRLGAKPRAPPKASSRPSSPTRAETEEEFELRGQGMVSLLPQPPTMEQVGSVIGVAFAPELKRLTEQLRGLPTQHQYAVCALARLMDDGPVGCRTLHALYRRLRAQIDGERELLSFNAFQHVLQSLAVSKIIAFNQPSTPATPTTPKTPSTAIKRTPRRKHALLQTTPRRPVASPRFGSPEDPETSVVFTVPTRKVRMALSDLASSEPGPFRLLAVDWPEDSDDSL